MCFHMLSQMKALTVRGVDPELSQALEREKRRRGTSTNATVLALLRGSLGLGAAAARSNGLAEQAGTWTDAELEEFERATASLEQIDPELWA